jgi:hypothetical protein
MKTTTTTTAAAAATTTTITAQQPSGVRRRDGLRQRAVTATTTNNHDTLQLKQTLGSCCCGNQKHQQRHARGSRCVPELDAHFGLALVQRLACLPVQCAHSSQQASCTVEWQRISNVLLQHPTGGWWCAGFVRGAFKSVHPGLPAIPIPPSVVAPSHDTTGTATSTTTMALLRPHHAHCQNNHRCRSRRSRLLSHPPS